MCTMVDIIDDDSYEEDEEFSVRIMTVSPASVAHIGSDNRTTKIIRDNQGILTAFSAIYSPLITTHL